MSALAAARQTAGLVADAADFAVHHPARTALRLVGAARGTVRVLTGDTATVVPPNEPMSPPIPVPTPEPMPGPGPVEPPEPEPAPQPGGLREGEVITAAGTIGLAPEINPNTGLPHHPAGRLTEVEEGREPRSRPYAGPAMTETPTRTRTYEVRTYGCQMNVHDSERLTGLLEDAGYVAPVEGDVADVVVFNTCAVRENADNKLYGNLGHLAPVKAKRPGMQIAVGGCLAQKDRGEITRRAPWVDVVFGTHNIGSLPVLLERARVQDEAQVEILESLEVFPSTLPTRRESAYAAWVSVSVGCNNTCTFCIVPALRGTEKDRRPGDVLAEVRALVAEGVSEVTLLGQNVNTYGVEFGDRLAFGKLLRACGEIDGLERVRFTSPHPSSFTDDVIAAMAETPNVMPQLHMPLQSGSDRVLRAMRRSYRQDRFLGIIDRVRAAMPEAAISTDIIVGFPGETEDDFAETMKVVELARFAGAFTFQYSKRPGTPAATLDEQVPKAVVQERYERLVALADQVAWDENKALVGRTVELMVSEGEGRKDGATHRLTGRARDNRLVHFATPEEQVRPGDVVEVEVTYAAPHHLVADGAVRSVRRTRSGDAWQGRTTQSAAPSVSLGLPTVGAPAPLPAVPTCD